jgi:hypothetical protein
LKDGISGGFLRNLTKLGGSLVKWSALLLIFGEFNICGSVHHALYW